MFLELFGLRKKCEQRITESLTELFWEFYSVIWVEKFPNRNCFGIHACGGLGGVSGLTDISLTGVISIDSS